MQKTDTDAVVRQGGRYFRDPDTGVLQSEADYLKQQQAVTEETETPVPSTPAKRKGI